ncbi:MAG: hypothetical protein ABSD27_09655 [Bryobacteraceae bacterium]|jgi:hypothetical protein
MGNVAKVEQLSEDDQIRVIAVFWFAMVDSALRRQLIAGRTEEWEQRLEIPRNLLDLCREAIASTGPCYMMAVHAMAEAFCPDPPCVRPPVPTTAMKKILTHMLEVARR